LNGLRPDGATSLGSVGVGMTGFQNAAIHDYRESDKAILHVIARDGWEDLVQYAYNLFY
jgi:hypothetical protein